MIAILSSEMIMIVFHTKATATIVVAHLQSNQLLHFRSEW